MTMRFCVVGAGRIGNLHAANVADNPRCRLVSVVDPVEKAAADLAGQHGARAETDPLAAFDADDVDAVLIGAPTNIHVDLILEAAKRGKPILCEKPLDLDIDRVEACLKELGRYGVPLAMGFNRRFDPTIVMLKAAIDDGEVGKLEMLLITSRDPAPPPIAYVKTSGGYFRDSSIHDLDLARWLLGEEPVEVSAFGSNLVSDEIRDAGDFDTAMTTLRTASGKLCHINNSRRAVYGFDQRIEAFGSKGMIQTMNQHDSGLLRWTDAATAAQAPLKHFFLERYQESFMAELDAFIDAVEAGEPPSVTGEDGRRALLLANAALASATHGKAVQV